MKYKRGFSPTLILIVIAVAVLVGGGTYVAVREPVSEGPSLVETKSEATEETQTGEPEQKGDKGASLSEQEKTPAQDAVEPESGAIENQKDESAEKAPEITSPQLPTPPVNKTSYGKITEDETWRGEHHVAGDIRVERGVTLTVEPGTIVRVAANQDADNLFTFPFFDLKAGVNTKKDFDRYIHRGEPYRDEGNHISIKIFGALSAIGTPDEPILITSDAASPGWYDWNVFNVENGVLSYVTMEYYRAFGPGDGVQVLNSTFRHVGECAVCANSTAIIENNALTDAGHELIDMHNSSPTIRNNTIGPNPDRGCFVIDGGSPTITGNTIQGCVAGINYISPPGNPVLDGNTFLNNEEDIEHNY